MNSAVSAAEKRSARAVIARGRPLGGFALSMKNAVLDEAKRKIPDKRVSTNEEHEHST